MGFRALQGYKPIGGGGSLQTFTITGIFTNASTSSVTVLSGAAVGDLLILCVTNGSNTTKSLPSEFTSLYADVSGAIGYRVMRAGDSTWTLSASNYATLFSIRGSAQTPVIDVSSHLTSSTSGSIPGTPVTPTSSSDAAIMIFLSSYGATSGTPSFTTIVGTGVSGPSSCGMAIEWTQLTSTAAFSGDSAIVANATGVYLASSTIITLK